MNSLQKVSSAVRKFKRDRAEHLTRICFAHVPKCAGTSITNAIRAQAKLTDKLLYGSFTVDDKACIKAADVFGEPRRNVRDRLIAYALAEKKHSYIGGHFHTRPEMVTAFREDWHFITVLRHPVDRWISGYVYDRHKTAERGKVNEEVESFIKSERGRYGGMTYLAYFSNIPKDPSYPDYGPYVDEAEANLKNFALVGTVEKLSDFARDFAKITGKPLDIKRGNATPKQNAKADIQANAELMAKITELCQPDIELYNRIASW